MGPKRNTEPPLTYADRLVTALLGGICGFGTATVVWFLVMYVGGRHGSDVSFPFYWTLIVGGVAALLAFVAGPERTMNAFERVWAMIGVVLFWRWGDGDSDGPKRRGNRR
jgi:hypothetical protein